MKTFEKLAVAIAWLFIAHHMAAKIDSSSMFQRDVFLLVVLTGLLSLIYATFEAWKKEKP